MASELCPICNRADVSIWSESADVLSVDCPVCKAYEITRTAAATVMKMATKARFLLAGQVRRHATDVKRPMRVSSDTLDAVFEPSLISVIDKQNALLFDIAARSQHPGAVVRWQPMDCVVVDAEPGNELTYHLHSLIGRNVLQAGSARNEVVVTSQGWEHVERLRSPATGNRADIFVAMSFSESLRIAWETGIKPGISAAGYRPKRVDSDAHNDKIDDRIIAGIRACYATVVDVTTQNVGAYFEAGFAMGLGRPVVWTVQKDDLPNLHFDTRQFSHIVWSDPADLAEKLTNHLLAVFGRGPATAS